MELCMNVYTVYIYIDTILYNCVRVYIYLIYIHIYYIHIYICIKLYIFDTQDMHKQYREICIGIHHN